MKLLDLAYTNPAAFAVLVKTLRANGIAQIHGMTLGDEPRDASTPREKTEADPHAAARRQHDTLYASSSTKPPFREPPPNGAVPRAIVQRLERDEAANGARSAKEG